MSADPRSRAQRRRDTEHRLTHDVDLWVASASSDGAPYLVPLSFDWYGEALLVATPTYSPTGRNLAATRAVRLGLGHTRDVSMIDGEVVEVLEIDDRENELSVLQGFRFLSSPRHTKPLLALNLALYQTYQHLVVRFISMQLGRVERTEGVR